MSDVCCRIGSAFFLYQQAMGMKDEASQIHLLLNAYKVHNAIT